jgi:hypothetical protein
MMTSAVANPPSMPIHSQDSAASGSTRMRCHGHKPATTTSASRIVVLLTVPGMVIVSSRTIGASGAGAAKPPNDLDRTGFDVLSMA